MFNTYEEALTHALSAVQSKNIIQRIFDNQVPPDQNLWGSPEANDFLGWLSLPNDKTLKKWIDLARSWMGDHTEDLILIGIGGSALGARLLAQLPKTNPSIRFHVLDTLDHDVIGQLMKRINPKNTKIIIASKSGSTIEIKMLTRIFSSWMYQALGKAWNQHFCTITDPNSPLEAIAIQEGYLLIIHGEPSIGGRFSALSAFGLFPAICLGIDIQALVSSAHQTHKAYQNHHHSGTLPSGAALAAHWWAGHQTGKPFLQCSGEQPQEVFAKWLEQLISESTGKEAYGLLPFFQLNTDSLPLNSACQLLKLTTSPQTEKDLDVHSLPCAMVHAFYATAIYAAIHKMNPFDQPDVESTKKALNTIIANPTPDAESPISHTELTFDHLLLHIEQANEAEKAFVAILDYQPETVRATQDWGTWIDRLQNKLNMPILRAEGPSYLHSIGQLFKGAHIAQKGLFIVLAPDTPNDQDLSIPGEVFGIAKLRRWQAMADLQVLKERGRTVISL